MKKIYDYKLHHNDEVLVRKIITYLNNMLFISVEFRYSNHHLNVNHQLFVGRNIKFSIDISIVCSYCIDGNI